MKQLEKRLQTLGYRITRNQKDMLGRTWEYRTSPINSGGPHNFFHRLDDIARYVKQVEQVRAWQGC